MRSQNCKIIILGHKFIGESDKLIYLYSEEFGKLIAKAKGARKINSKFSGHLETLNFCEASLYFSQNNVLITEISLGEESENTPDKLEILAGKMQIAEITNKMLFERQTLPGLIKLIQRSKIHLSKCKNPFLITGAYIIKFLDKSGILPDFKEIESSLELKYLKFLQFLKNQTFSEIEKIILTKKEEKFTKTILKKIIENETNLPAHFLNL